MLAIVGDFVFSSLLVVVVVLEVDELESAAGAFIEVLGGSLEVVVDVDEDEETGGVIVSDFDASFDPPGW